MWVLNHFFSPMGFLSRKNFILSCIPLLVGWILVKSIKLSDTTITTFIILSAALLYSLCMISIKRLRDANLPICFALLYIFSVFIVPMVIFLSFYRKRRIY